MLMKLLVALFLITLRVYSSQGHLEANPLSALKHNNVKVKIGKLLLAS